MKIKANVVCLVAQFFDCSWCGIVIISLSSKSIVVHETSVLVFRGSSPVGAVAQTIIRLKIKNFEVKR